MIMATATLPATTTPLAPAAQGQYRMTVNEFERIEGLLNARRVELIDGLLVEKGDMDEAHAITDQKLGPRLNRLMPKGWFVRADKPVRVHATYRPFPDFAVVQGDPDTSYAPGHGHPIAADVAVVIEISDSTLAKDSQVKRADYAKGRIPVYWIVNLVDRQVEVYTGPRRGRYTKKEIFKPGDSVPVMIAGDEVGQIVVDEILPPEPATGGDGGPRRPARRRKP
jgi:Uma2 family endonuclease